MLLAEAKGEVAPKGLGRPSYEPLMRNSCGRPDVRSVPTGYTASNNLSSGVDRHAVENSSETPETTEMVNRDTKGRLQNSHPLKVKEPSTLSQFQSVASALSRAGRRRRFRGSDAASINYGTATKRLRCDGASGGADAGFADTAGQKGRSYRTRMERGHHNVTAATAERTLRGVPFL